MKKKDAEKNFELLYESTYQEAIAYIICATGSLDNAENILSDLYYEMHKYFLKHSLFTQEDVKKHYISKLKETISKYDLAEEAEEYIITAKNRRTINSVDKILGTGLDISDNELFESMLNKKIYSYIMNKPLEVRRIFLLYFYCNYSPNQISELLGCEESDVTHIIYAILKEVRDAFLKNRIIKQEEQE